MAIHIGGYTPETGGSGSGITVAEQGPDGALTVVGTIPAAGPSFLAGHPKLSLLYAVSEVEAGTVTLFAGGRFTVSRPTGGASPCHLAVDPAGEWLAVANYADGVVSLHRLDDEGRFDGPSLAFAGDGSGPDLDRQLGPHAHQAVFGPDGVLHVTDLGADEIRRYRVRDRIDVLPPVRLTPGSGPRHLACSGTAWYVAGELDGQVRAYDLDWRETGAAAASAVAGVRNYPSHLELHNGLLYVANRGPNTITVLDPATLTSLAEVPTGGDWPRHFGFVGKYLYVANQGSGQVTVFALRDGIPEPTGDELKVGSPTCVIADPDPDPYPGSDPLA
ncbi:lactonase family protein [Acrocarpospora catenulata]|uniref:lactonase family protein n=1 Tax=Acrocarpospora catenulata TaxID=2836182 RepID=UPI001BDA3A06|nr:beta-propeller fold lactonase family protein [Acrocarpospora catenulata]